MSGIIFILLKHIIIIKFKIFVGTCIVSVEVV